MAALFPFIVIVTSYLETETITSLRTTKITSPFSPGQNSMKLTQIY